MGAEGTIKAGGAEPRGEDVAFEARRRQALRARYAYGFVFFATNLLAWFVRDYGAKALRGLHRGFLLFHLPKSGAPHIYILRLMKAAFRAHHAVFV
jgi:hypothetical protein